MQAILRLRDRGNTVVVVEHEEAMIRAADRVVEIGPGAGERGGRIVFQGTPAEMEACSRKPDGRLSGRPPRRARSTELAAEAESRLDPPCRRAGQQPQEHHRRVPAGTAVPGDGRERLRQEHAGRGHALSRLVPPHAQGVARAAWPATTFSATARSTTWSSSIRAPSAARRGATR